MGQSSYELGWGDGYAEGYACKLADATEPFAPQSLTLPDAIERAANHIQTKLASIFRDDRPGAIGLARGIIGCLKEPHP